MPERNFNDRRRAQQRVTFILGPDEHRFECRMRVKPEVVLGYEQLTADTPNAEALVVIDNLVTDMLLPEHHAAWQALRERDDDETVELDELRDISEWLVEQVINRPLAVDSSSSDGPATTGTTSMVGTPSPAAVA